MCAQLTAKMVDHTVGIVTELQGQKLKEVEEDPNNLHKAKRSTSIVGDVMADCWVVDHSGLRTATPRIFARSRTSIIPEQAPNRINAHRASAN